MNKVRDAIANIVPKSMYNLAASIYRLKDVPHYWVPYAFKHGRANPPKSMGLWVTWKCNSRCLMCPFYSPYTDHTDLYKKLKEKKELSTKEIKELIGDAHRMGVRRFSISGGEPFLRKDMIEIIKYIKKRGCYCRIFSNGLLIDKELSRRIIKSGLDCLILSLDGPKEIHNKIRGHNKAFQKLMEGREIIQRDKKIMKSKYPLLQFNVTISALNQNHLSEIIDIGHKFGIDVYYGFMYYTPDSMVKATKRIIGMKMDNMSDQDLPDLLKNIDAKILQKEFKKIKQKEKKYKNVKAVFTSSIKEDEVHKRFYEPTYAYCNKCFSPWISLMVDSFGEVYPCRLYTSMGNVRDKKLSEIWNGKKYIEFRKRLKKVGLYPMCAKCCNLNKKIWSYLPKGMKE